MVSFLILEKARREDEPLRLSPQLKESMIASSQRNIKDLEEAKSKIADAISAAIKEVEDEIKAQKKLNAKAKKEGKYNFYGSSDDSVQEAVACFRMIAEILNLPIKVDLIRKSFAKNIENENDKIHLTLCAAIAESLGLKTQLLDLPSIMSSLSGSVIEFKALQ